MSDSNPVDISFIWDFLPKCPEHKDRRQTAWGTKSKEGLANCIRRLADEARGPAVSEPLTFDNPWMKLCIKSDKELFKVSHVTYDHKQTNTILENDDSIGLIATDNSGRQYLAKLKTSWKAAKWTPN